MSVTVTTPEPSTILGVSVDEGVAFGLLVALVLGFIVFVEYVRTRRAAEMKEAALMKEQYANAAVWGVMLTMTAGGYVASKNTALRHDVSILLTCGATVQLIGLGLLWVAPRRCSDVSLPRAPLDFAVLMTLALGLRSVVELTYSGYLPVDATGDGCIQLFELVALALCLRGIKSLKFEKGVLGRALIFAINCDLFGSFCYGDLDTTPMADKVFAISIYVELVAYMCLAWYVFGVGSKAVNSMAFPPMFVQAVCRGYFWYVAIPETKVREPTNFLQAKFEYVLFSSHVAMGLLALAMSAYTVSEIKPALPHELLRPEGLLDV